MTEWGIESKASDEEKIVALIPASSSGEDGAGQGPGAGAGGVRKTLKRPAGMIRCGALSKKRVSSSPPREERSGRYGPRPAPLHVHSHVQLGSTYRGGTPPATDRSISLPPSSTSARCSATRICLPTYACLTLSNCPVSTPNLRALDSSRPAHLVGVVTCPR